MMTRPCEICAASEAQLLFVVSGHRIVRCTSCSLVFVADPPPAERLETLYGEEFFQVGHKFGDVRAISPGARRNARLRLRWIGRSPGRLLDVGCATGDFLEAARDQGWDGTGVEWSRYAAEEARRRGFEVHATSLPEAPVEGRRFDLVTMWDYIEHVVDPLAHLRRAREVLEPGGLLVLSTGDVSSPSARLFGRKWHLMIPPKHLFFFDPATITRLLERAGFRRTRLGRPGKYVNVGFMADKTARLFPSGPSRLVSRSVERSGLGRVDLYVNLRDIMTVAAEPAD